MHADSIRAPRRACRLLNACSLLTLGASPLGVFAQAPSTSPATVAPAAPAGVQRAPPVPAAPTPASPDEAGYTIGINLGQQLHAYGVTDDVPIDRIVEGLKDGLAGKKAAPEEHRRLQAFLRSELDAVAAKNAAAAKEYLERNGKEKGVKATASGLQYRIIETGNSTAASPQPTDQVTVQYRGKLLDGTEFDSSYQRGAASTVAISSVIKGWQEALVLMKPGAKWQFFIPPELAYGQGSRPAIPGGSLLIFDLELQSFKTPPAPPKPAAANSAASSTAAAIPR